MHCLTGQKAFDAIDSGRSGSVNGYLLLFLPRVRRRGGEATAPVMRIAHSIRETPLSHAAGNRVRRFERLLYATRKLLHPVTGTGVLWAGARPARGGAHSLVDMLKA